MISKVVPSGRGLSIALRDWADPCDYPKLGWLERIIFDSGDERSRRPCALKLNKKLFIIFYIILNICVHIQRKKCAHIFTLIHI